MPEQDRGNGRWGGSTPPKKSFRWESLSQLKKQLTHLKKGIHMKISIMYVLCELVNSRGTPQSFW